VAVDDALPPDAFARDRLPRLDGIAYRVVIVLPSLTETPARSAGRAGSLRRA
jgi:hypothetical protein